ncbi:MAG: hypothetical protein ACRCUJ_08825 [Phocaeicola sp.]
MMKKLSLSLLLLCLTCLSSVAQSLSPLSWTAYGITFQAPRGILVEEDTEESFVVNDKKFYITIQYLDSEGMTKEEIGAELKALAQEDGVEQQGKVESFELPQFYGASMTGICEEESCYYSYLMTKAAGNLFFVSILYTKGEDKVAQAILKSFKMEE